MPNPPKENAIRRLQRALEAIPELKEEQDDSPAFLEWQRNTRISIEPNSFGESSGHLEEFKAISYSPFTFRSDGLEVKNAGASLKRVTSTGRAQGLESAAAILRSMIDEVKEYWPDELQEPSPSEALERPQPINANRVFVIHGKDHGTRDTVARFLKGLELEPVILEEQPDRGLTVIARAKFEQNASGGLFVVALLTPDDVGGPNPDELQPRARQNVIFELGYFVRAFGRNRVRALMKGDVEIPSDYVRSPLYSDGRSRRLANAAYQRDEKREGSQYRRESRPMNKQEDFQNQALAKLLSERGPAAGFGKRSRLGTNRTQPR